MGIDAYLLEVEVDIQMASFPKWQTVGLAESEVKESKERVVSSVKNSGYEFPQRKITINLAPADIKKEGTALDLPIALGLLSSSVMIDASVFSTFVCVGELSLTGDLRPVRGVLPTTLLARKKGFKKILVPKANGGEASVVEGIDVYGISSLAEAVEFLSGRLALTPIPHPGNHGEHFARKTSVDFEDVCGQYQAKRAIEVAASGGHNLLFCGSPGSGKTLLSSRISTILPNLTFSEALETTRIYSVAHLMKERSHLLVERPFRSPHHSISDAGLVGGGTIPKPGEVSLAHNGVLFLDELPEFKKHVLELLRQPLESCEVTITRAAMSLTFPAQFMMVAAMNPCPCGYYGHPRMPCTCSPSAVQKYRHKLSGPLLDRIDLQIDVPPVPFDDLNGRTKLPENSATIQQRVMKTRHIQKVRFENAGISLNARMGPREVRKYCVLDNESKQLMRGIMDKFHLSARSYDRILKVSRTIADMEESEKLETKHLLEAVQYRSLDRNI